MPRPTPAPNDTAQLDAIANPHTNRDRLPTLAPRFPAAKTARVTSENIALAAERAIFGRARTRLG